MKIITIIISLYMMNYIYFIDAFINDETISMFFTDVVFTSCLKVISLKDNKITAKGLFLSLIIEI